MSYRISELAKLCGLSRSTLLYYDRMGLLSAGKRSIAGYRLYTKADLCRLEMICSFRQAGIGIKDIQCILGSGNDKLSSVLKKRLRELGEESIAIQKQQRLIAGMLNLKTAANLLLHVDKDTWVRMLKSAGMNEKAMDKWHAEFERVAPEAHHQFLISLGINEEEVRMIRKRAKN